MTRASRLSTLSTNAWAHTRTRTEGRYTRMRACANTLTGRVGGHLHIQPGYCYTLHHLPALSFFFLLSHHPQPQPGFRPFVLPCLHLRRGRPPSPVPVPCPATSPTTCALQRSSPAAPPEADGDDSFSVYATSILRLKGTKNKQPCNSENAARNKFN